MVIKDKKKMVKLQNLILGVEERKLKITEESLEILAKMYKGRITKDINDRFEELKKIGTIKGLFERIDWITKQLDKLIEFEAYYEFDSPTPTEHKRNTLENVDYYILDLIKRKWSVLKLKLDGSEDIQTRTKVVTDIKDFLVSFDPYLERLSPRVKNKLKSIEEYITPK